MSTAGSPRLRFPWRVVAVVAVLVAAALVALLRGGSGDEVRIGQPTSGEVYGGESERWWAPLPYGGLTVYTSTDNELGVGQETRSAPGGGGFVQVTWTPQPGRFDPLVWPSATLADRREPPSSLTLVAGGRRYPLAEHVLSSGGQGQVTLPVAGVADLQVLVSSGGQEHRAVEDEPSRSRAPVYAPCQHPGEMNAVIVPTVDCSAQAVRARYVAGLGWAPSGRDWLIVDKVQAELPDEPSGAGRWRRGEESVDYAATGPGRLTLTVSGASKPARTFGRPVTGTKSTLELRAYLVPSDERAQVTVTYRVPVKVDPDEGETVPKGAPATATISATGSQDSDPIG